MNLLVRSAALAALLIFCGATYAENELGRLFYTPSERRALDQREVVGQQEEAAPPTISLNGRIIRSDGKTVTWTNGSIAEDGAQPSLIPSAKLKVGQSVEVTTGEVHDRLKGGRIVVRQKP